MPTVRRLRVSNPHKRHRSRNSRRRSKRNPVGEVLIVANPKKSRRHRKSNRSYARRTRNPFKGMRRTFQRRRGHRRSNPGIAGFNTNELLKLTLGAAAGVVASKYVTQMVLGANNSGPTGYAGSAIVTLALGWAAHKFVGKDAATGVIAGGLGALALRIFQENVSGTSPNIQGLGDPDMVALGVGMGEYRAGVLQGGVPQAFGVPAPVVPVTAGRRRG